MLTHWLQLTDPSHSWSHMHPPADAEALHIFRASTSWSLGVNEKSIMELARGLARGLMGSLSRSWRRWSTPMILSGGTETALYARGWPIAPGCKIFTVHLSPLPWCNMWGFGTGSATFNSPTVRARCDCIGQILVSTLPNRATLASFKA